MSTDTGLRQRKKKEELLEDKPPSYEEATVSAPSVPPVDDGSETVPLMATVLSKGRSGEPRVVETVKSLPMSSSAADISLVC